MRCAPNVGIKMVAKIRVVPREIALDLAKKGNTTGLAVISICSKKEDIIFTEEIKKKLKCDDIITLVFADITETDLKIVPELSKRYPIFTADKAQEILNFLNHLQKKDIKLLLVHCDAGISRSGAIGIFAVRYLGLDESEFRKKHKYIGPNSMVYDILMEVSGLHDGYQKWWEKEIPPDDILFT